jgi:hypothetical protein
MTGTETALIITACGTLISAVASSVAMVLGALNARKIGDIKRQTDGMKNELVAEVRSASLAKGNLEGRKEQAAEGR